MKIVKYFFLLCLFFKSSYGVYQNTNPEKLKAESEVAVKGLIIEMKGIETEIPPKIELQYSTESSNIVVVFNHDNVELSSEGNGLVDIDISKEKGNSSKSTFDINFKGKGLTDEDIELLKSGKSIEEDAPNNEEMKIIKLTAIYR